MSISLAKQTVPQRRRSTTRHTSTHHRSPARPITAPAQIPESIQAAIARNIREAPPLEPHAKDRISVLLSNAIRPHG